jgi:hypothetical protein
VSDTTLSARLRPAVGALGRGADALATNVRLVLAAIIAGQVLLTVALFFSVEHNGWLTYQGGDQIWLLTSGWLLGQGTIPYALVGWAWPLAVAPLSWVTGASSVQMLPLTTALQVLVLGPIATLAVYDIATRVAGRVAGLWSAAAFVVVPVAVTPLFVDRYQERWTDQVLVQFYGLTQLADFPSTVLVLVSAALVLRSLDEGALREAALAGSLAGLAAGMKPANYLFLAGPALAYLVARRWTAGALFAVMLAPATLTLAIWKERGLGTIPAIGAGAAHVAASAVPSLPIGDSFFDRFPLELDDWQRNMSNLREFFWSARLAQWAPLAGAIAVARRSIPASALLLGWLLAYVVVKGSSNVASIENGSFWRLVMPGLPAYLLLVAAIPLLVPTLPRRLGRRLDPPRARRPGRRLVAVVITVLAVVPLGVVLAATPQSGSDDAIDVDNILVPVDGDTVAVRVERVPGGQRLTWSDSTTRASTFYKVYRTAGAGPDVACDTTGADRCELVMDELATTRARSFLDTAPVPGTTYRIGVAANWIDDTGEGDVFVLSPPVAAAP